MLLNELQMHRCIELSSIEFACPESIVLMRMTFSYRTWSMYQDYVNPFLLHYVHVRTWCSSTVCSLIRTTSRVHFNLFRCLADWLPKKPSGYCNYVASCVSSHLYTYTKSLQHTLLWVTWSSCMIHWLFIHTNTTQAVSYRYKFKVLWSVKLTSFSLAHILAFLKIDSPPILTLMMKNDFIAIFWFIISFNILYYILLYNILWFYFKDLAQI